MNTFKLMKDIELIGKSIKIKDTLIIGDVHIGYEEALNKTGIFIPRTMFKQILREAENTLRRFKIKKLIINGDLKHEFGKISKQEWNETIKFLDMSKKYCDKIIIIKGNHDKIIGPIADQENIEVKNYEMIKDIYITHGDKIPDNDDFKNSKRIIIGHEHPSINIRDSHKIEKFKTFLKGKYESKILIVMPSFNPIEGTDVLQSKLLSPFLKNNKQFKDFETFITADKIYEFGKLKQISKE